MAFEQQQGERILDTRPDFPSIVADSTQMLLLRILDRLEVADARGAAMESAIRSVERAVERQGIVLDSGLRAVDTRCGSLQDSVENSQRVVLNALSVLPSQMSSADAAGVVPWFERLSCRSRRGCRHHPPARTSCPPPPILRAAATIPPHPNHPTTPPSLSQHLAPPTPSRAATHPLPPNLVLIRLSSHPAPSHPTLYRLTVLSSTVELLPLPPPPPPWRCCYLAAAVVDL